MQVRFGGVIQKPWPDGIDGEGKDLADRISLSLTSPGAGFTPQEISTNTDKKIVISNITRSRRGGRKWWFLLASVMTVDDIDFDFENSPVRIVLTHEIPDLPPKLSRTLSARIGQEVQVPYWTARELVLLGYAKFREEDVLNYNSISKIHWRETIPASRQMPALQPNFYCLLRRHVADLKQLSRQDQIKLRELERTENLIRDIVNCRIRKIVSLAASPTPSEELIQGLTYEERTLYTVLNKTIVEWKDKLLGSERKP